MIKGEDVKDLGFMCPYCHDMRSVNGYCSWWLDRKPFMRIRHECDGCGGIVYMDIPIEDWDKLSNEEID